MASIGHDSSQVADTATFSFQAFLVQYGVYVSLAIVMLVGAILEPQLYSSETIFVILRQASQLGIVAIGQTLVLLVAGLDLSVGGVIVLTSIVIAKIGNGQDGRLPLAILASLGFGTMIGLGNGLLVTKRNVPPLVATLGMLVLVQGGQTAYTRGLPGGFVPDLLNIVNDSVGHLPVTFLFWVLLNVIMIFVLKATPYGRKIYAVGSNREAARLSGINVHRVLISVYILAAIFAVLSGIVLTGYVGYVDRTLGRGLDLDSIAAAVVGGTAFIGGRGGLAGTVAGVFLIQLLSTLSILLGLGVEVQFIIKGLVVIGAVALYSVALREA
ncbi:MAG: ABC transporter permease [Chloroflexi bacterium]|nr:MAG: ABC transporter permease [Phototrophicales bacterium]RMF76372.1 MAG: ABC transporter permease [Chloroflexota bacterium]